VGGQHVPPQAVWLCELYSGQENETKTKKAAGGVEVHTIRNARYWGILILN